MQKNHFFLGGFRKKCHICIRNPNGGIAQLARAPALQAGGRRFDSDYLHKKDLIISIGSFLCYSFLNRCAGSFRLIQNSVNADDIALKMLSDVVLEFIAAASSSGLDGRG